MIVSMSSVKICILYLISFLNLFLFYLFLAALGLCCCAWAFSRCGEWWLLFVAVHGLLIVVASLCCGARALGVWASVVVAHGLSCSAAMWDLPGPGLELMFPVLAGRFLTTVPPGKPLYLIFTLQDKNVFRQEC